ncbi:ERBB receptor feedback inhibitor 1 [Polymixia lowei]
MAGSQHNYWGQHDMNSLCFGLATDMEHNLTELQQPCLSNHFDSKFHVSHSPCHHNTLRPHNPLRPHSALRPHEGDQVVPSFRRLTVLEGHHREPKPLPPLPDPEELMSDEAADSEVEFFTSERRRLLPKGYRGWGQVNYAYQESPSGGGAGGTGCMAHSWPGTEDGTAATDWTANGTNSGPNFGTNSWTIGGAKYETQGQQLQREDHEQMVTVVRDTSCRKQPDRLLSSRLRHSYSGPAYHHLQRSSTPCPADKPAVPPRVPLPPKPSAFPKNVTDKPPKIPPRVPLVPACPPRSPSPKSLPLYINGIMPATQSFAPNPEYVSRASQRPRSVRVPPADEGSPCIVPVMKDGRQASATHYFLLPCRPAYMDRLERYLREPDRKDDTSMCNPELGYQNR